VGIIVAGFTQAGWPSCHVSNTDKALVGRTLYTQNLIRYRAQLTISIVCICYTVAVWNLMLPGVTCGCLVTLSNL